MRAVAFGKSPRRPIASTTRDKPSTRFNSTLTIATVAPTSITVGNALLLTDLLANANEPSRFSKPFTPIATKATDK